MLPDIDVERVYRYIPGEVRRPDEVTREGQGGVTMAGYNQLAEGVKAETYAHLSSNGVPSDLWGHILIREYMEMQVAARILRRIRAFQELADSLFADSNIKLKTFFSGVANIPLDVGTGSSVDDTPLLGELGL